MSFHINMTASSVTAAKDKLHDAYAPASVKAVIESVLNGIPRPRSELQADVAQLGGISEKAIASNQSNMPRSPMLVGILIEAYGHIDERGGTSEMQKLLVRPLYD